MAAGVTLLTPLLLLCGAVLLLPQAGAIVESPDSNDGYQLSTQKQFLVLAPRKVRPLQTYEMHVTLFQLHYTDVTVKVMLSQDEDEYATTSIIFNEKGTKRIQVLIPETVMPGNHKLVVEGLVSGGRGDPIFRNETKLEFDPKYVSLFIQTDKPMYYPPQKVNFRIVGVNPDLKPVHGQDMTIYIKDTLGNVVRRWLNQELQFGMYSSSFEITYPVKPGDWAIEVEAYGTTYKQPFKVDFYYRRIFEVNVTTPLYVFDTDWGLMGTIYGEHWSGMAASGNASLLVQAKNADGTFMSGEIRREIAFMKSRNRMQGQTPFSFSMTEMKAVWGELIDKQLFVTGWINDFHFLEIQNGTSTTKVIEDRIIIRRLGREFRTFKPGIPFLVYFAIERSDGTRYEGRYNRQVLVEVNQEGEGSTRNLEEKVVIPSDAVVRYEIMPRETDQKITINARHIPTGSPVRIRAYRYFSTRDRYISVTTSTSVPTTEEYMTFTVRTNFMVPEVNYVITSGGNILLGNLLTMISQQKTFSVALSRKMSPQARMVVYCVKDEEVLMDTLTFYVRDTRLYNSSLTLNLGKDFNYHSIELVGKGAPGAFIAMNGLDYEWYRRGAHTFLNEEKIKTELMGYNEPEEGPYKHIWNHDSERWDESVYFTSHSGGVDFITTLDVSGLVALSDMNFTIKQEYTGCNRSMGVGICLDHTCYDLKKECDDWPDCEFDGFDEMACPMKEWEIPRRREPDIDNLHKFYRYFEDTSWAWRTSYIKPNGRVEMKLDAPEDTLPYVISAFILHPEYGLSLIEQPVQHDTTRRFFMSTEYPSHTRRGEQVGIRLGIFNYWDQDIESLVTLHGGDNYRFVHVEDFGYVSAYNPRLSSGDVQIMVELEAGTQRYIHFPVLPIIQKGQVTVRITAFSPIDKDEEEINIDVTFDGVWNKDHIAFMMDLYNTGSQLAPYFDIPVPQQFVIPGERFIRYYPGSNVADVYMFGDVVSPGFFEDHLDAENTAMVPDDSAEGYMYDYAVNLQTLKYLQSTRALDQSTADKALEYMQSILMRQYAYMQPDGSFKQFRRTDNSCVWVTSFILRKLHETQLTDWAEQVYVSIDILNKIALWLVEQVNDEGAFVETADHYYDRLMEPTTVDPDGVEHVWHIPVTAHVVITFGTTERLTGDAKIRSDIARSQAADYLASKIQFITNPFQMAITAYALQLAKHKNKDDAFQKLDEMKIPGEHLYWASRPLAPNPSETINAKFYISPRLDYTNLGEAVQATSYALLLYLQRNMMSQSEPIMRWLLDQHNDYMAWSSTQDGLMALEALTAFALEEANREFFNIEVSLGATSRTDWGDKLSVNRTNFFDLQSYHLPEAWGEISIGLQGTGYGYIGVTVKWNVDKAEFLDNPNFNTFDVTIKEKIFSGRNASLMSLTPCVKWRRTDLSPQPGMVVVTIEIPTGYVVNRDEIVKLYWSGIPGLKRARFRNNTLIVFLETISAQGDGTCFNFRANRWYPVANVSITHGISVREYAETGIKRFDIYDTYTLFHLHICKVCGSFQCPYCPNYNGANTLIPTTSWPIAVCLAWLQLLIVLYFPTWLHR